MLAFIAVCAAIWLAQELLAWRRGRIVPLATEATPPGEVYSIPKAVIGLVMIVAYGGLLPIIGFPIATAIFIALWRSEEHTSELQSLMRISYAVFCLHKKKEITKLTT